MAHVPSLNTRRSVLVALAATATVSTLMWSCGGPTQSGDGSSLPIAEHATATDVTDGGTGAGAADAGDDGLTLRLSDAKATGVKAPAGKPAPAKTLSDADTRKVFGNLKGPAQDPDDSKDFALRERSAPPPLTGDTLTSVFPPMVPGPAPVAADKGPLTVVRFAPEGAVPVAANLSVTFSKPMVALTSQEDAAKTVPVTLSPVPAGKWRWLGTKTLIFDPDVRFAQATRFAVEVPAGTKAADGTVIKAAKRWTFETPAPKLVDSYPQGEPHPLRPAFYALFDQRVNADAILKHVTVSAGGARFAVEALPETSLADYPEVKTFVESAKQSEYAGRYVVFRATKELPADARVSVEIGAGTPSAEGPLTTKTAQSWTFRTYARLRVTDQSCLTYVCPPDSGLSISFNNPLDSARFDAKSIRVEPALEGMKATAAWGSINIEGRTKARTEYTVTLPAGLRDKFGQTLGEDTRLRFNIGSAEPMLAAAGPFVVLDPAAKVPAYDVHSVNEAALHARIYRVTPKQWSTWAKMVADPGTWSGRQFQWKTPPGDLVWEKTIKTDAAADDLAETHIDLSPALKNGLGNAIVVVEGKPRDNQTPHVWAWVQSTKLGLDAFVDGNELVAWTTKLADGSPRGGVAVEVAPFGIAGKTDEHGIAKVALADKDAKGQRMVLARDGADEAFLPEQLYGYGDSSGSWIRSQANNDVMWHVFDDRQMYKPGEEVHLKGWIRRVNRGEGGDVGALDGTVTNITYRVVDSRGNDVTKGSVTPNGFGGFDLAFSLPKTPNLGYANVTFHATGPGGAAVSDFAHGFQVQEFRRPEYEVTATPSQGPFMVGDHAEVTAEAKYYAGGGLANAPVRWTVTATPTNFAPPKWDEFVFGQWRPWWDPMPYVRSSSRGRGIMDIGPMAPSKTWNHEGTTDASGKHVLRLDFDAVKPTQPMEVSAQAVVTDVNRQGWAAGGTLLVHPSAYYVGLRAEKVFTAEGEPFRVDEIVVDQEGGVVVGRSIVTRASRVDWTYDGGNFTEKEVDTQECKISSAKSPVRCTFTPKQGGTYRIKSTITDEKGRSNETTLTVWVAGGKLPPVRDVEQQKVELVPDQKEYTADTTAKILVRAPFTPAEGILTLRRSGIVHTESFHMTSATTTLSIPIAEGFTPNITAQVDLVGAAERVSDSGQPMPKAPKRPAFATGSLVLKVPPKARTFTVTATPTAAKVAPGEKTKVNVVVTDSGGKPVRDAEVALVVVDEAILALTPYTIPSPIDTFYGDREAGGEDLHSRAYAILTQELRRDTDDALMSGEGAGGGGVAMRARGMAAPTAAPAAEAAMDASASMANKKSAGNGPTDSGARMLRTNFNPLAVFAPTTVTDGDGRASVSFKMPDNLTRYRIVAVAADKGNRFGKGESNITARLPLMVRPSGPRFLNFGDRFEFPVVIQNQTDSPMDVRVALRATNASLTAGGGRTLRVAANDRVEVRFPVAAAKPGTARFQAVAVAGAFSDAAEVDLPVWTPATTEAFATYGEIDKGAIKQPFAAPSNVVDAFGGLEITTSSTQLQALTDAFLYLESYPYDCAEQISSRILAVAALRPVLSAFKAQGLPPEAEIHAAMTRDIERLRAMQQWNGAYGFWAGSEEWPYLGIHAAHAIVRAKAEGYTVPAEMLERSRTYLREIESHIPAYYGPEARRTLIAYALYVRRLMGDPDTNRAQALVAEAGLEKLPMDAVGWVLNAIAGDPKAAALRGKIITHLQNRATETAGAANFVTGWADGSRLILASDRRTDGIVLEALMAEVPKNDLIPKVVRGLLAHRSAGHWGNTQEDVFILLALKKYFQTYENVTPDFVARAWFGTAYAGDHTFKGRTTERYAIHIPMKYVASLKKGELTLSKDGEGRLYYRLGMTYAPADLTLKPADYGFTVTREYEAVDDPSDVVRLMDGTWKIRAGAQVRVHLRFVNEARRYHVAVVDPLPAGLEALNPALAVTGPIPKDPNDPRMKQPWWWWNSVWYEHTNMRDERAEAFTSLLWEGTHEYTYYAKATTPGTFVVPPAKAEEMYAPETFGRSGSDKVIVE